MCSEATYVVLKSRMCWRPKERLLVSGTKQAISLPFFHLRNGVSKLTLQRAFGKGRSQGCVNTFCNSLPEFTKVLRKTGPTKTVTVPFFLMLTRVIINLFVATVLPSHFQLILTAENWRTS